MELSKAAASPVALRDGIQQGTSCSSFTDTAVPTGQLLAPVPISPICLVAPQPDPVLSPSDPLTALVFDIIYHILLPYLQVGDILSLQATSKTCYGALGGCKSLWRRRVEAAVSGRRLKELDEIVFSRTTKAEQDGQPLKPFEISKFLRATCESFCLPWT